MGFCLIETIWEVKTKLPAGNSREREADEEVKRESPSAAGESSSVFSVYSSKAKIHIFYPVLTLSLLFFPTVSVLEKQQLSRMKKLVLKSS